MRAVIIGMLAIVAVPAIALIGLRAARAGVLPGTEVAGVELGGLAEDEARDALEQLAEDRARARIVVERGEVRAQTRGRALGYSLDVEATLAEAMARGRQSNPLAALGDHLTSFVQTTELGAVQSVDDSLVQAWVDRLARRLAARPREGRLVFTGALIEAVQPRPGADVRSDELAADVTQVALAGGGTISAPVDTVAPVTTEDDVDEVQAAAEVALSGSITLERGNISATLTPEDIAATLRTVVVGEGDDASLELRVRKAALVEAIGADTIERFDREPESASIELGPSGPVVVPGHDGFAFDANRAVAEVTEALDEPGERVLDAPGKVVEAELTTKGARELQVVEQVSEFTTEHACCESRVTNIHRISDIID